MPNYDDLFMEGVLAAIKALDNADEAGGINAYIGKSIYCSVMNYLSRVDVPLTPKSTGKGTYYKVSCCSLDRQIKDETGSMCFGDMLQDTENELDEVVTRCDFERMIDNYNGKHKEEMYLFLDGYDRKDVAKAMGISYEALRQNIGKMKRKYVA
ncbi:MAG: hypothetical protein NC225_12750 [Clostridium sp.]|nr:hypothetical protein [Clostridium sp.]MCM1459693.1 hypothetical protein [Bacteroides sp.]